MAHTGTAARPRAGNGPRPRTGLRRRAKARCGSRWRKYRQQLLWTALVVHRIAPRGVEQIDPQRRPDIRRTRMRTPCLDTAQMFFVEIARPPHDAGRMAREMHHMLA